MSKRNCWYFCMHLSCHLLYACTRWSIKQLWAWQGRIVVAGFHLYMKNLNSLVESRADQVVMYRDEIWICSWVVTGESQTLDAYQENSDLRTRPVWIKTWRSPEPRPPITNLIKLSACSRAPGSHERMHGAATGGQGAPALKVVTRQKYTKRWQESYHGLSLKSPYCYQASRGSAARMAKTVCRETCGNLV
jgi:hypothetical protein